MVLPFRIGNEGGDIMFLRNESNDNIQMYAEMLEAMGALSNLFADTPTPYLNYRATENILCRALHARNLSRSDCSVDAIKGKVGIGIKTFLNGNGRTNQKIAEFNKSTHLYIGKEPKDIVEVIAMLRNERIQSTKRIYNISSMIYHCIVREPGKIQVFECNMDKIKIDSIKNIKSKKNIITFEDGINEYSFNLSKSTLYKRFYTENILLDIDVSIIKDPHDIIRGLLEMNQIEKNYMVSEALETSMYNAKSEQEYILLPLYSIKKGTKYVPEKSNLNQWNALGRSRHPDESYIKIPSWINKRFSDFFPPRNQNFKLMLPDTQILNAKVCQDNSKALMTNPNKDLGRWLLRHVMNLEDGELLTYSKLEQLGIDSVVIYKVDNGVYTIDFRKVGSFELFEEKYLDNN